jgi:hypothetical protein
MSSETNESRELAIAGYIARHPALRPYVLAAAERIDLRLYPSAQPLPSAAELSRQLLADAEFRSLRLGGWLTTTDGQIIAAAVARVLPPTYEPVFNLVVDALMFAAREQQREGRQKAGLIALASIVGGMLLAIAVSDG